MTISEMSTLVQSGVLSVLAVMIVYRIPDIWAAFLKYSSDMRTFHAEQAELNRKSQSAQANQTEQSIIALTAAVEALKLAMATSCRYPISREGNLATGFSRSTDKAEKIEIAR